jgi:ribosome-associated toxin RatA of RatAB toxin-antitoxin module
MPKTEVSITINAPIEKVFDAVADPKIIEQISSGALVGIKGKNGELGSYADWEYLKLRSRTTVSEVSKPNKLVQEMTGAMPGRWIWSLKQEGQIVKVDFCIEYKVPGGILGKIANKLFLGRINQKNGEKTMHGLKTYCEK